MKRREIFRKLVRNGVKILSRPNRCSVDTFCRRSSIEKGIRFINPHLPPSSPINTVDPTKQRTRQASIIPYKRLMQRQTKKKKESIRIIIEAAFFHPSIVLRFILWDMHTFYGIDRVTERKRERKK